LGSHRRAAIVPAMRQFGVLLLLFGIASCVLYFMNMELRALRWIDTWGEQVAWGIRGGLIVLGLLFSMVGGKKKGDGK
jgi:hypothetical protein